MYIKHFREVNFRVPDPMRPGHSAFDRRLDWSKTHSITHEGKTYDADSDGWFDVPTEVGVFFVGDGDRNSGKPGWCTPEMVDEELVAGRIRADAADALPHTRDSIEQPKKGRGKAAASA